MKVIVILMMIVNTKKKNKKLECSVQTKIKKLEIYSKKDKSFIQNTDKRKANHG